MKKLTWVALILGIVLLSLGIWRSFLGYSQISGAAYFTSQDFQEYKNLIGILDSGNYKVSRYELYNIKDFDAEWNGGLDKPWLVQYSVTVPRNFVLRLPGILTIFPNGLFEFVILGGFGLVLLTFSGMYQKYGLYDTKRRKRR